MSVLHFQDEMYRDDRLFVLYLCRCTVQSESDGTTTTTIYHENPPQDARWCLVTYRNTARYPAVRTDPFESKDAALAYMRQVEPTVPLISLGGRSPVNPMPYKDYCAWKEANGFKEYDYKSMYTPGGSNPMEMVVSRTSDDA